LAGIAEMPAVDASEADAFQQAFERGENLILCNCQTMGCARPKAPLLLSVRTAGLARRIVQ
jgi:hypothetical protein